MMLLPALSPFGRLTPARFRRRRVELRPFGIRVVHASPGFVQTVSRRARAMSCPNRHEHTHAHM